MMDFSVNDMKPENHNTLQTRRCFKDFIIIIIIIIIIINIILLIADPSGRAV